MLDGLNNILALLLREPDRGMAREFLLANRVLLAELERIAPTTDGFGDTHPKAVLKAVLEYYGRHQSLPDERALYDYSQTIPHLNDDLGRGQKIRDQLEELKEWQPTMADPAVLPGYALNQARNMWLQQRLSLAARMCTVATEVGSDKKKRQLLGADDALAFLRHHIAKDVTRPSALADPLPGEFVSGADALGGGLTMMRLSDVPEEKIEWLWRWRLLANRGNIFSADADCGKSTVAFDIVSRITTGRDWPDGAKNALGPRSVIVCAAEDGHGDTVRPRMRAMEADMDKVIMFRYVIDTDDEGKPVRRNLSLTDDVQRLERTIAEHPDVALIVVDPLSSFIGDADPNKSKEVRTVLDSLKGFMERFRVAMLVIMHSNKRSDVSALGKVSGAVDVGAAWRNVWAFQPDPDDELLHIAKTKANLAPRGIGGMKFRIAAAVEGDDDSPSIVKWEGRTAETANSLLKRAKDKAREGGDSKLDLAKAFIRTYLADGSKHMCQDVVRAAQDKEGISQATLYRAQKEMADVISDYGKPAYWELAVAKPKQPETARAATVEDIL